MEGCKVGTAILSHVSSDDTKVCDASSHARILHIEASRLGMPTWPSCGSSSQQKARVGVWACKITPLVSFCTDGSALLVEFLEWQLLLNHRAPRHNAAIPLRECMGHTLAAQVL